MLDASGKHFLSFQEALNRNTNESDRPTLKTNSNAKDGKKSSKSSATKKSATRNLQTALLSEEQCQSLQGDPAVYTAQNARMVVNSIECQKPRVVYSKSKLTERQAMQCALMMSEYDYCCGSPICPPKHPLMGKFLLVLQLHASLPLNTRTMGRTWKKGCLLYLWWGECNSGSRA